MAERKKLGEIFIEQGLVTPHTVERVLQRSAQLGRRFGTVMEDLGLISGEELATALAAQYQIKTIERLSALKIAPELLRLVPMETAMQFMVLPVKRQEDRLAVAVADPTDTRIMDNIAADSRLKVIPFLASREEIRAAICRNYLGRDPVNPKTRTVLVVDDERLVRTMTCDILAQAGYRTLSAGDGMEGYMTAIAETPHVVITDLVMPKLDGYGLLNALQNIPETKHIPVIMVTGRARDENEELRAFDKGFFDVLRKPISPPSLQARIKRAFHFYDHQYRLY